MTFREKSISKLYAFALAAVFALTLAGCGGGGGTTDTTEPPPMECPAGTTGTYPNCEPVRTQEQMCTDDGGEWRDGACVTAAMLEEERKARVAAATNAAGTKEKAIAAEAAQLGTDASPDAGLGGGGGVAADGTTAVPAVTTYSMTIERDSMDPATVKIADSAMAGDDDPKFMQDPMNVGVGNSMHVRTMEADADGNVESEVVFVSTDIEAPKSVAFAKFEGAIEDSTTGLVTGTRMTQVLDVSTNTENDPTGGTPTYEALDLNAAINTNSFDTVAAIKAPGFSTGAALSYTNDESGTPDDDEAYEVAGTYNSAPGTYRCNGGDSTPCTVTRNAKGELATIGAGWIFTPAADAMSDQPDYDYYSYGFWLKKTKDADGAVTYNEVETFAMSSVAESGSGVGSVLGRATYEGGATGVYVKNVFATDGTIESATSGHFTAAVTLNATFGQVPVSASDTRGTIAENMLNTISGDITNFMLSGGEDQMWNVDVAGTIANGGATGTAKGGNGDGSFSATFHGSVAAVDGVVPQPGSVVGEFNAGFSDGSVAGAFGARKMAAE